MVILHSSYGMEIKPKQRLRKRLPRTPLTCKLRRSWYVVCFMIRNMFSVKWPNNLSPTFFLVFAHCHFMLYNFSYSIILVQSSVFARVQILEFEKNALCDDQISVIYFHNFGTLSRSKSPKKKISKNVHLVICWVV